jgi:hypothetical protein
MSNENEPLPLSSASSTAQSEQDFIMTLKGSIADPERVNLNQLWQLTEQLLQQLPDLDQLRVGGTVMTLLAEIHAAKADRFLMDWEERHNDEGPVMEEDLLAGLVQRTMYLDLSDLITPKTKATRKAPTDSVANPVEKKQVLKMLEQMEDEKVTKQQALSVAHDENVSAWIEAIVHWWQQHNSSAEGIWFSELSTALKRGNPSISPVKLFLALLLGSYRLQQPDGFYSDIWITLPDKAFN